MRVKRESLIRIAKETAQERAYNDKNIIAAYLTGSLLKDEPFLGGVTDIDLVLVTDKETSKKRQIVKLTHDFHLDISFHAKNEYQPARELRVNPWLGYELYDPLLLHETQHFFEFTQASLRGGFEFQEPGLVMERCRKLYDSSRKIWIALMDIGDQSGPKDVANYLHSLYHAVNVIAELQGPPLTERRMLLDFPALAENVERPGLSYGFLGLLGGTGLEADTLEGWLPEWKAMFQAAFETGRAATRINTARLNYYQKCFESMLIGADPKVMLWPLFNTWTLAAVALAKNETAAWEGVRKKLGFSGKGFVERIEGLDRFLDEIDILLDEVAEANGLEPSTSM